MEKTNVYGVVLAGGKGTRMGNVEKPKQFMEVGGKPIIIHTLEKFVVNPQFERVIVLSPKQWITYTQDIIKKYILLSDKIDVIEGGATRNDTIMNAISHIEKFYGLDEETIIVTHDSVRPFVTHRILEDNIHYAKEYGACDTVIPATILGVASDRVIPLWRAWIIRRSAIFRIVPKCIRDRHRRVFMQSVCVKFSMN